MSTMAMLTTLGLSHLLSLGCCSPVVEEDEGAQGHGQVGPAHSSLAAEEQCWQGAAGIPQQQTRALLRGRETGMDGTQGQQGEQRLAWASHGEQAEGWPHQ